MNHINVKSETVKGLKCWKIIKSIKVILDKSDRMSIKWETYSCQNCTRNSIDSLDILVTFICSNAQMFRFTA